MTPVVHMGVGVWPDVQVHEHHQRRVDDQSDSLSSTFATHVPEVGENVSDVEADEAKNCSRCSDTVSVRPHIHREQNSSKTSEEVEDDYPDESDAIFNACAHEKLTDHIAGDVLEVAVEKGWGYESPHFSVPDFLDIRPAPGDAAGIWCQEVRVR